MRLPVSQTSKRLDFVNEAWTSHFEATKRREAGENIIMLTIGDPDFPTPAYVNDVVYAAISKARTHYAPAAGETQLRETLARLESESTGRPFKAADFTVFNGATGTLYAVLSCIGNVGDNVVVSDPLYLGYEATFAAVGMEMKRVPASPPGFLLDVERLISAIDDHTVALLVNTPTNPTGNVVGPKTLQELADECRKRDIWVISDEVYSLITFEKPHISMLKCAASLDNVVVIDALSKSHAMSGWRVGWCYAPLALGSHLESFALGTMFCVCQFVQDGAARALERCSVELENMRDAYRLRRDHVIERISAIPGLSAVKPQAGMFVMVDTHRDSAQVARELLDQVGVAVTPGFGFGETARTFIRVGLTHELAVLRDACNRIEQWAESTQLPPAS